MEENPRQSSPSYRVQAVERALDILDCFSLQNRELSLSDIVHMTGLNISTAKRLAANLVSRGYLKQDRETKHYQLGMRLFELGGVVFSSFSLREAAAYPMSRLMSDTGATVLLGIAMDDQLVYVDKREGRGIIRVSSDIGWRRPLHYGMLGMVLMAYLAPEDAVRILQRDPLQAYTHHSITDKDAFSLRLETIRKDGYVLEREEAVEGLVGIGAPVRDYSRQVIGALGVVLPVAPAPSEKDLQHMIDLVKAAGDETSAALGYLKI